ncbi:putative carrier protein PET8 [Ixodes scapularis]
MLYGRASLKNGPSLLPALEQAAWPVGASGHQPSWQAAVSGAVAGGIAAGLTTPFDAAKTRIMLAEKSSHLASGNMWEALATIWKQRGLQGLFSGVLPRVVSLSVGGFIFLGAGPGSSRVTLSTETLFLDGSVVYEERDELHRSSTAFDGRVFKKTSEYSDYKVILPRLPQGILVTNSLILHADITGRPYKASDFKEAILSVVDRKDVLSLGPYQMSHVWMVTFGNAAAKLKIKAYEEFLIKGKKCIITDPCKEEIKLKLLWLPIPMPDSEVRKVLEPFGNNQGDEKRNMEILRT